MRTANFTELRTNLKSFLDGVISDSEPLIVHRSGSDSVVVISLEEYNSIKETEYIMRSPTMMDIIRKADQEIKDGKCLRQKDNESIEAFLARVCTE